MSVFLLFYLTAFVFPVYHCHEASGLHEHPIQLHLLPENRCCEFHGEEPSRSHNHHVHFLIEDRTTFAKLRLSIKSATPLKWIALPENVHLIQAPLSREFLPFGIKKSFHQEYFTSFSGLSPPQV
jgi:hypothetical protein